MDDQQIINLYLNRNEQAISESSAKYGRYCTRIAMNVLRNSEDSEECVNDTWMASWNSIPPQVPRILKAFFGKITRNLSLKKWEAEHAAKRGGGEVPLVLDELQECVEDQRIAGWSADGAVIKDVLNDFLKDLPEDARRLFVRRYFEMEPVKDLASDFGFSESKVKMTLLRTRKQLAVRLLKEGIEV